eukprot:62464-Pleurochrysis_carterae.AAC.1
MAPASSIRAPRPRPPARESVRVAIVGGILHRPRRLHRLRRLHERRNELCQRVALVDVVRPLRWYRLHPLGLSPAPQLWPVCQHGEGGARLGGEHRRKPPLL